MSYRLPAFPLLCNIATPPAPGVASIPTPPYRLNLVKCQLTYGRRVNVASTGGTGVPGIPLLAMSLLLPKLTDIRGPQDSVSFDMVEVPAASGRWYWTAAVDDIAKGFANEHRTAAIFALAKAWIAPYS